MIGIVLLVASLLANISVVGPRTLVAGPNVMVDQDVRTPFGEPFLAASPTDPNLLIGASMYFALQTWSTRIFVSHDGGYAWSAYDPQTDIFGGGDVQTAFDKSGAAYMTVLGSSPNPTVHGKNDYGLYVFRSTDGWHWDRQTFLRHSYDHEQITIDNTGGPYQGRIYLTVLYTVSEKPQVNEVGLLRSSDGGKTFQGPVPLARGWFFSNPPIVLHDGRLVATLTQYGGPKNPTSPANILYVVSRDGGVTFSKPQLIAKQYSSKDLMSRKAKGETDFNADASVPQYAVDASDGPYRDRIYLVWSDLRYYNSRVLFSYSADGGRSWTTPQMVAADSPIKGTQYQPAVAVSNKGVVGISWFDTRDSGPHGYDEYFTASSDGGRSFMPPIRVSSASSQPWGAGNSAFSVAGVEPYEGKVWMFFTTPIGRYVAGGDYMGLAADADGNFHPYWIDARSGTDQLWTATVSTAGQQSLPPLHQVALTNDISLVFDAGSWDDRSSTLSLPIRLKNTSTQTLYPPFAVTVGAVHLPDQKPSDASQIVNASNHLRGNGAKFVYANVLRGMRALPPGAVTEPIVWKIKMNRYSTQPSIGITITGYAPLPSSS